ncbi:PLP-dependent transferase [Dacryopinax primogenitus]|uniref:PLP-dependent transferase n=1 Tax=Dacryopinax primogenitus (strain DJM 731) TaxID=1858805 RepID=M5GF86_DACPD|nr:PLP-dependent transferase [Dacryopinax primogenitus]EJU03943.1 PLP-dependent transferase [Dacryopinax primogenitus]
MSATLDPLVECRPHFPALTGDYIFADSAGGSQCLKAAADEVADYLINSNVQHGADYSVSVKATQRVQMGVDATRILMNAESSDEIVFGSSSTQLIENLARAYTDLESDDEIVVSLTDHEANTGPWTRLAARYNLKFHIWTPKPLNPSNPFSVSLTLDGLIPLLSSKTRIVAFTACSNILGELTDVKGFVKAIREKTRGGKGERRQARGAEVCVDCVAYAPHRRIDVQDWDVDYCVFSYYKVYGPHASALYARLSSLATLSSLAHFFFTPAPAKAMKLQPGGAGYELTYGTSMVLPYIRSLGGPNGDLDVAFKRMAGQEGLLVTKLIGYLTSDASYKKGVRIVGYEGIDSLKRAPTISFIVVGDDGLTKKVQSKDIVATFDKKGNMGIRWGHFYAYRLCSALMGESSAVDGVVRVSFVHYNTTKEVDRLIAVFEEILA